MTKYAKLKAEKDAIISNVRNAKDNKELDDMIAKAEKIQNKINNMTIAEAMREAE